MQMRNWLELPFFGAKILASTNNRYSREIDEGPALAEAIVETVRDPLLVLDKHLRIVTANRAFCHMFNVERPQVQDQPFHALAGGQWNIEELKSQLADILSWHIAVEAYEVESDIPGLGRRRMQLNAREILHKPNDRALILLTMEDVTERRAAERETAELLREKETLLQEMQHRMANSLQIIATILLLKARNVQSDEIRLHLKDAHQRIMSVAAVQQQLDAARQGVRIELAPYLSRLCETLAASMVGESRPVTIEVQADGSTASSAGTVSIGLIVTELVINALKHAFADDTTAGLIAVTYGMTGTDWRLTVSDNGAGMPNGDPHRTRPGLGTSIVEALARQLDGRVERSTGLNGVGTSVSITHGPFRSSLHSTA
jgi:chemotaxis protein methyltransferase CheR